MKVKKLIQPILSIILAFLIGAIVIKFVGESPLTVYKAMASGAFGTKYALAGTLTKTITMIFVGLSYGFAYKCGLVNIGIEGQLYMGGLASALVGIYIELPSIIHIPLCILAGFLAGAVWGGIVGFLKVRFNASEMITTVMMNYIAIYFVAFMVNGPIKEEAGTYPQSEAILPSAELPNLVPKTQLSIGLILALIAIAIYIIYWKWSVLGFKMNMVGTSSKVAEYAGIPVKKMVTLSMFISGGLGGLAGSMEVLGVQHKIMDGLSAGYGFDGIAVSLLGGNNGIGILVSSFLFGALRTGGNAIQMFTKLPNAVIYILQALVILFVVTDIFKKSERK
ncbi:MAG: ABC transporter permease [Lachnospiraceae bacterium]